MNKEFIPYEQALVLKQLGFNEPCFGSYVKGNEYKDWTLYLEGGTFLAKDYPDFISTPLYQQAFRWFREKYNMRVWVEWGSEYLCCAMIQHSSGMKESIDCCSNNEEAEQACLDKLIEICKNK